MEEYKKICPFCKTEINSDDIVKICNACGIPHHEECWDLNNGCSTFGCSEHCESTRKHETCSYCGADG